LRKIDANIDLVTSYEKPKELLENMGFLQVEYRYSKKEAEKLIELRGDLR